MQSHEHATLPSFETPPDSMLLESTGNKLPVAPKRLLATTPADSATPPAK